jgi:hypothetical protein
MEVIGKHGENIRNGNGRRLIEYCIENDLIIAIVDYIPRWEVFHSCRELR